MAKIIVTGGAGFIGSTLVDRLVEAGNDVAVIDDLSSGAKEYLNAAAKFYQFDICSPEISAVFESEKPDFVYHLAAQIHVPTSVANPEADNKINILGGLNVLENARRHGAKKLIFASTGGAIYGDTEDIPTPESAPTYPVSPYGIHKLAFEKYLNYYFQVYGFDYAVLRFANVYGPRQFKGGEAGVIAIFCENAVASKTSYQNGDGLQTRDFVYVDDVVEALALAKDIECRGEINIATGRETSLLEVIGSIESALGRPMPLEVRPAKLGEQRRSALSPARAKAVLDWEPQVDLEEGIRRTIAWTREKNK